MRSGAMRKRLTAALHDASDDLLRYFLRRLDREDAADALADVMATAWARIDGMPDDCEQARMWLFGIARNVLLHAHRGNVRRSQLADWIRATLSLRAAPAADAAELLQIPSSTARGRYQRAKAALREALDPAETADIA